MPISDPGCGGAAQHAPLDQSPPPAPPASPGAPTLKPPGKLELIIQLLRRPTGATLEELVQASGWQAHSVRGALAAAVPKKLGARVISEKLGGVRRYRAPAAGGGTGA